MRNLLRIQPHDAHANHDGRNARDAPEHELRSRHDDVHLEHAARHGHVFNLDGYARRLSSDDAHDCGVLGHDVLYADDAVYAGYCLYDYVRCLDLLYHDLGYADEWKAGGALFNA